MECCTVGAVICLLACFGDLGFFWGGGGSHQILCATCPHTEVERGFSGKVILSSCTVLALFVNAPDLVAVLYVLILFLVWRLL